MIIPSHVAAMFSATAHPHDHHRLLGVSVVMLSLDCDHPHLHHHSVVVKILLPVVVVFQLLVFELSTSHFLLLILRFVFGALIFRCLVI